MLRPVCNTRAFNFNMASLLGWSVSVFSYFYRSVTYEQRLAQGETEPFVLHKTIHATDLSGKDLVLIGDVHGCYDEMMLMMDEVKKRTKNPFVTIFVGDMINKGPKSEEVLDYIMTATNTYCVRGNHEHKILKEYFSYRNNTEVQDSRKWIKNLSPKSVDFLKNLPYTLSLPSLEMIVVHAGLVPGIKLHLQNTNDMINMRNLFWKDDMFHEKVLKPTYRRDIGKAWADQWQGPEHVYFGHDAVRKLQLNKYSTGLDTGCVYGGELTAILFHLQIGERKVVEKEYLRIKPLKVYRPVSD